MKAQWSLILGALAIGAAPLAAQAPFQTVFQLDNVRPGAPIIDGGYSSPYIGAFQNGDAFAPTFNVWCVDLNHHAELGSIYDVWVTPLYQTDFSHTRMPADADLYRWASVLAGDMNLDWTGPGSAPIRTEDAAIQNAIWTLLGESGQDVTTTLNGLVDTYADLGLSHNFWAGVPPTTSNDWSLITCDPGLDKYGKENPVSACGEQEFLVETGTPQSVTPEPAAMSMLATGLVGLMGAGSVRRRRKTA